MLAPVLHAFTAQHPALRVRLDTHTSQADLVRDRFDVATRHVPQKIRAWVDFMKMQLKRAH